MPIGLYSLYTQGGADGRRCLNYEHCPFGSRGRGASAPGSNGPRTAHGRRSGEVLAQKLNRYQSLVTALLSTRGISIISAEGQPFHDPATDAALFDTLTQQLLPTIQVKRLDCTINDPAFATACAESLLSNIRTSAKPN